MRPDFGGDENGNPPLRVGLRHSLCAPRFWLMAAFLSALHFTIRRAYSPQAGLEGILQASRRNNPPEGIAGMPLYFTAKESADSPRSPNGCEAASETALLIIALNLLEGPRAIARSIQVVENLATELPA